ncbi:MAG: hypothetical protein RR275_02465 [Lachnospiraceae bacterium]
MKKAKKLLALTGVIILVALYASTLVFALFDHSTSLSLLKISIAATIFVPVISYVCILFFKLPKKDDSDSNSPT